MKSHLFRAKRLTCHSNRYTGRCIPRNVQRKHSELHRSFLTLAVQNQMVLNDLQAPLRARCTTLTQICVPYSAFLWNRRDNSLATRACNKVARPMSSAERADLKGAFTKQRHKVRPPLGPGSPKLSAPPPESLRVAAPPPNPQLAPPDT